MSFLIQDDELLKKYNGIQEKVKSSIKKKFDSELVDNEKYLKAEIKSNNGNISINFWSNKIPKEGSQFIYLSVILIDSVFTTGKHYYPQVVLEECKYVVKEKKMPVYINEYTDDIEFCSCDIDREENSDEENSNEESSDEENSNEEH